MKRLRIAFLSSHGGSNMQAIIDACKKGVLDGEPVAVISNNKDSQALMRAEKEGVPGFYRSGNTHPNFEELDEEINQLLCEAKADVIVLAGYMKKIGPKVLKNFNGKILNIHPALLPQYGGKGMYGRRVHEAVIENGEKVTGVTVHTINENYDEGTILNQWEVPVLEGDTVETLGERVLQKEHEIYVDILVKIVDGTIVL